MEDGVEVPFVFGTPPPPRADRYLGIGEAVTGDSGTESGGETE